MCKVSSSVHFVKQSSTAVSASHDSSETHWEPNTDVYVTDSGLVIKSEIAGMRREDLELTVDGNRLTITGQREDECRLAKCNFLVMAINYGSFETVIDLPEGYDLSQAKAGYQNGFLRIDVPVAAVKKTSPVSRAKR